MAQRTAIAHQIFQRLLGGGQNTFDHRVSFRVNGGGIQRVVAVVDTQEARALFKGFRPQTADFQQLLAVLELTILVAPGDDVLRHHAGQAGDAGQQRNGGGVQVNADGVHTVFHHRVQLTRQLGLADVVLILADANGFRVDFHQLGQGILQTAGDGDRAAQRHVEVRKLLRRQLGGGVNGSPGFADDHLLGGDLRELFLHVEEETLGFTRGGTVADGHQLNVVLLTQRGDGDGRFGGLAGVGIDGIGSDQFTGGVDDGHFHPGAQARIESHGGAQPGGRGHQQIVQVAGEDVDCLVLRAFAHGAHQLGFEMHQDFDPPGPADDAFTPAVRRGVIQAQAQVVDNNLLAVALFRRLVKLRVSV